MADKTENSLKESGLKKTRHRLAVIRLLKSLEAPVTAEDIYFKLKEKNSTISLSTVYRTL
ncbi:MAG: transcriptional repressor, partial [Clostridiales bacterium]|nr:transcriptional repressor [Clostridiales bacterium]